MKYEIKNERKRTAYIPQAIAYSFALCMLFLFCILDIREFGAETGEGTEMVQFWIAKVICLLLIPFFIFLLIKTFKQLSHDELIFRVSKEGIFAKITDKISYNIDYKDIEKVTYKTYSRDKTPSHDLYLIFIFLKEPSKYLDREQILRIENGRKKIPEAGDIAISPFITNEKLDVVLETINYYLSNEMFN